MHKGSCLCGEIQYQIDGEIGDGFYCHCQRCRKASGSAFASNAILPPNSFKLVQGEQFYKAYFNESTGLIRTFCNNCGSPILSERPATGLTAIRLGTLDSPLSKGPKAHIFVASKAEWNEITDELPCFDERPKT